MNIQTESNNKRLLEALDHVDIKYVAELVDGLRLPKSEDGRKGIRTFRHAKQLALIAACALLLGVAIPTVQYVLPMVNAVLGGNAGAGSDSNESEHYIEEELQNKDQTEDAIDGSPNTEEAEASSEQSDLLEEQKVLNPLNVEALEKIPSEGVLEALAAKAKAMVADSTTFEVPVKESPEHPTPDYFFSLNYVIRYYYSFNTGDEYVSEKVSDAVRIDITAGKGNEKNIRMAEYMTFLALLFNTYPDCVGFLDYKYFDYNFNRNFSPRLLFCPDYAEYGYDTIYDYIDAVLSKNESRIENVYIINFNTNRINKSGSDVNLYDTIFKTTESK